jgi:hypothetical protein
MMHALFCVHAYECDAQAEEERELARAEVEGRHCRWSEWWFRGWGRRSF